MVLDGPAVLSESVGTPEMPGSVEARERERERSGGMDSVVMWAAGTCVRERSRAGMVAAGVGNCLEGVRRKGRGEVGAGWRGRGARQAEFGAGAFRHGRALWLSTYPAPCGWNCRLV